MLYLVPTPIGNLEDITLRAIRVLKEVSLVLAEDTRTTRKLMTHYGIETPLRSYHTHNEHHIVEHIITDLKSGKDIALVSDAGTPGISDPGFLVTRACVEHDIKVCALPGATAFVPALVASGLPTDSFFFDGFLPHKKGRQTRLKMLSELTHTFVIYESPFRLVKCLEELGVHCGTDRRVCVAREISKIHESVKTLPIAEMIVYYKNNEPSKGEIAIVVEGKRE